MSSVPQRQRQECRHASFHKQAEQREGGKGFLGISSQTV